MDHKTAERTMAVEKYLLDEFTPGERDEFEEHFFCCEECAKEIKLGAAFMAHARQSLKTAPVTNPAAVPEKQVRRGWLSRFSPAFAIPAMALMLGVVAFQNLVQFPAMRQELMALNAPAVLPSGDLKSGASRGEANAVSARLGEAFQLTIDIPDTSTAAHTAELQDASGKRLWTIPISADAPKESLAIRMPGDLPAGRYTLVVRRSGETNPVSSYAFELRRN